MSASRVSAEASSHSGSCVRDDRHGVSSRPNPIDRHQAPPPSPRAQPQPWSPDTKQTTGCRRGWKAGLLVCLGGGSLHRSDGSTCSQRRRSGSMARYWCGVPDRRLESRSASAAHQRSTLIIFIHDYPLLHIPLLFLLGRILRCSPPSLTSSPALLSLAPLRREKRMCKSVHEATRSSRLKKRRRRAETLTDKCGEGAVYF